MEVLIQWFYCNYCSNQDTKIAVAHCNFKLRGQESDDDAQFVHSFCLENKIVIHATEFETEKLSEQYQKSIQVTARELRYIIFSGVM